MKVTQNLSDLHLSINEDTRTSIANHRSKTGNESSFQFSVNNLNGFSDVNLEKVECFRDNDEIELLNNPRGNSNIIHHLHVHPNSSIAISISPVNSLTSSKSENNIFEKNASSCINDNSPHFNVASLSDLSLSDDAQYYGENEHHYMNDLSKTQVLNRLSDDDFKENALNHF